eukprot:403354113
MLSQVIPVLTLATLQCSDPLQYRVLDTWTCLNQCPDSTIPIELPRTDFINSYFRYCRGFELYVDQSSTNDVELGTRDYPFRMLDDPFREVFNNFADQNPSIKVYVKAGVTTNFHAKQMPIILFNTALTLLPYSDDPLVDYTSIWSNITMYQNGYTRNYSSFNPTISVNNAAIDYNYQKWNDKGIVQSKMISDVKYKFYSWDSNITLSNFNFREATGEVIQANALFAGGNTLYKQITVRNSFFYLIMPFIFTQQGWLQVIEHNFFLITAWQSVSSTNIAYTDCSGNNPLIANNNYWNNNTWTGTNTLRQSMLAFGQQQNVTFINNKIINCQFPTNPLGSIYVTSNQYSCPPSVNFFRFQNNTIVNNVPTLSYFVFSMNYLATTNQQYRVSITGNTYINQTFGQQSIALFQVKKGNNLGMNVTFENNYFENIQNRLEQPLLQIRGQNIIIRNITFKNATLSHVIQITGSSGSIRNILYDGLKSTTTSATSYALMSLESSSNMAIENITIANTALGFNMAMSVTQSNKMAFKNVTISQSSVTSNYIYYVSQSRDVSFRDIEMNGITKLQSDVLPAMKFISVQPQVSSDLPQSTYIDNIRLVNSQVPLFNLESVIDYGNNNKISVEFKNLTLANNTLSGTQSMFFVDQVIYKNLTLSIQDCSIENNILDKGAFFSLNHNSQEMSLSNCSIQNNKGFFTEMSPVEVADESNKQNMMITNTSFKNHYGITQGLFHVTSNCFLQINNASFENCYSTGRGSILFGEKKQSVTRITNSKFLRNYAYQGGLFFTQLDTKIEAINCDFQSNFGVIGGVVYLQNDGQAVFTNSTFNQNVALKSSLFQIYNSQNALQVSGGSIKRNGFQYSFSSISYMNLFKFQNVSESIQFLSLRYASEFINYLQSITSETSVYIDLDQTTKNQQIKLIKGIIQLDTNLIIDDQLSLIDAKSQSEVVVDGLQYINTLSIASPLIYLDQSRFQVNNFQMSNMTSTNPIISNIRITNSQFANLKSTVGSAVYSSHVLEAGTVKILEIDQSNLLNNSAEIEGGSIYAKDVNFNIRSSVIEDNQAKLSGGFAYLSCSLDNANGCSYDIQDNEFKRNQADTSGGAIFYDLYSPLNIDNNEFDDNLSPYGPNVASYPYKLKVINEDISWSQQMVSGATIQTDILVGIFDQNDQLITNDVSSSGTLSTEDLTLQISGNTKVISNNGVYNFSTLLFDIYFRKCVSGEVTNDNRCKKCQRGYFSFDPTSSECLTCLDNAQCQGGDQIIVNQGFWRSSNQSTQIYQCFSETQCLGGVGNECAQGYQGKLCAVCQSEVGDKLYARSGATDCAECLPLASQFAQILGVFILLILYVAYIVQSVLRNSKPNKPQTVLIRILTNYFQVIMLVKDFDLHWPPQVSNVLNYFSYVSSSSEKMFSFDCVFYQLGMAKSSSSFYIKVIMYGLLPIGLSIIGAMFWGVVYGFYKLKGKQIDLVQFILVTCFVFIFIIYPQITSISFGLFNCVNYEDGTSYLKRDMNIQCWKGEHLQMALVIGIPFIVLWALIFPLGILWRLWLGKDHLEEKYYLQRYGLFYVGLTRESYYWEVIIVNFRKLIFIFCGSILSTYNQEYKALIGVAILFAQNQYANIRNPFRDHRFNTIDFHATYASMATLFGGLFFLEQDVQNNESFLTLLFVIILVYNVFFAVVWAYNFLIVIIRLHQSTIQKIPFLKFLKVENYETNLMQESEKINRSKKSRDGNSFTMKYKNKEGGIYGSPNQSQNNVSNLNLMDSFSLMRFNEEKQKQDALQNQQNKNSSSQSSSKGGHTANQMSMIMLNDSSRTQNTVAVTHANQKTYINNSALTVTEHGNMIVPVSNPLLQVSQTHAHKLEGSFKHDDDKRSSVVFHENSQRSSSRASSSRRQLLKGEKEINYKSKKAKKQKGDEKVKGKEVKNLTLSSSSGISKSSGSKNSSGTILKEKSSKNNSEGMKETHSSQNLDKQQ